MQLQAYKGYFEQGSNFYAAGKTIRIPERRQVTLIFEEPQSQDDTLEKDVTAMKNFLSTLQASEEDMPPIERIKLREVEI